MVKFVESMGLTLRKLRHRLDFAIERTMKISRRSVIYPHAWLHRRLRNKVVVVGITGSAGKTTTKDICATMLSQFGPCESTDRSANERFNVAQTVVSIDKRHQFAVIELSGSKPGHLDLTLQLTQPQIGVLTLIGRDHYSAFKSMKAIAEEKSKLIMRLPKDGVAVLNIDDPLVRGIGERYSGRKIWVGRGEGATLRLIEARSCWPEPLTLIVEHEGTAYTIATRQHGTQLALSVLSALGVALALDLPLQQAIDAIGLAEAPEGRMQIVPCDDGVVFVRDDWKAPHWSIDEPFAFMAAAEARRKIIIVGTVSDSNKSPLKRYPRVAVSARKAAELVVFVGPDAVKALKARTGAGDESIQAFATLKQAAAYLHAELKAGDLVLLKGSNRQDHLVRLMLDRHTPIRCWVEDCGLVSFCGRCKRLYQPSRFDNEHGQYRTVATDEKPLAWGGSADAPQLIVGLGNPGAKYANTPHNLGYRVLDRFAESLGGLWEAQAEGMVCRVELGGAPLVLFKPGVAINLSGDAVRRLLGRFEGNLGPCTIVYDDMDLTLGDVRYKRDGGDGGHNGLRSVIAVLTSGAFGRVRVGGRRAGDSRRAVDLVLERFSADEAVLVDDAIDRATTVLIDNIGGFDLGSGSRVSYGTTSNIG